MNWPKNSLVFCWLWFLDKPMHIGLIDGAKILFKLFISSRFELICVVRIPSKYNIFTSIPFDLSNQIRLKILFTCTFAITALKIMCFGDSNVKRHQDIFHYGVLAEAETTFVETYTFDNLKENIFVITGEEDYIIIHVLTNNIKYICYDHFWKSDYERKNDLIYLADDFAITIRKLIAKYPDMKIIISMVLPRYDGKNLLKMGSDGNEIINVEISKNFLEVENVILIKNCDMDKTDFDEDKFHLSKGTIH